MLMLTMKRMSLAVAAAGLVACSESVVSPAVKLPDAPTLAMANATQQSMLPFGGSIKVSCALDGAGEWVDLSGQLHLVSKVSTTADGGTRVVTHSTPRNVTGVGRTTGTKYRGTGMAQEVEHISPSGMTVNYTFVHNFRIIGQGPGNNHLVHAVVQQSMGPDGQMTANAQVSSSDCK